MKKLNNKGVVSIEFALICALVVLPVAIGVAKFTPAIIRFVQTTSQNLDRNSNLQEENNALLQKLLAQQQQQSSNSSGDSGDGSNAQ